MPDIDWYTLTDCSTVANEFYNIIINLKLFQYINKMLKSNYDQRIWLLSSIMYRAVHIFTN